MPAGARTARVARVAPGPSPEPSARLRRRLRAPERRAQILRTAAECFGTRGFRGTTTRDVANAAGVTEAALYRHFSGKEALYAAILDERSAAPDLVAHLEERAREGDDHAVFQGLALKLLETVEADPSFLRLLLYSALEGHEMARPFQDARMRRFRTFLSDYIARRNRDRVFRKMDAALAGRAFLAMLLGHLIVRQVFGQRDPSDPPAKTVAAAFASIFLEGVQAKHPETRRNAAPLPRPRGRARTRRRHG